MPPVRSTCDVFIRVACRFSLPFGAGACSRYCTPSVVKSASVDGFLLFTEDPIAPDFAA
jgi:hypothetical protein